MTDIVERLRGTATSLAWTASSDGNLVGLALEAAAEIEQLRKNENWQMTRAMKAEGEIERLRKEVARLNKLVEELQEA